MEYRAYVVELLLDSGRQTLPKCRILLSRKSVEPLFYQNKRLTR